MKMENSLIKKITRNLPIKKKEKRLNCLECSVVVKYPDCKYQKLYLLQSKCGDRVANLMSLDGILCVTPIFFKKFAIVNVSS